MESVNTIDRGNFLGLYGIKNKEFFRNETVKEITRLAVLGECKCCSMGTQILLKDESANGGLMYRK